MNETHAHHWLVEPPDEGTRESGALWVEGWCNCGESRRFDGGPTEYGWQQQIGATTTWQYRRRLRQEEDEE